MKVNRTLVVLLLSISQIAIGTLSATPSFANKRANWARSNHPPTRSFDNTQGHINWRRERLARYRSDPMLARERAAELAVSIGFNSHSPGEDFRRGEIRELIELYPKLPLDAQQCLASWYMHVAMEELMRISSLRSNQPVSQDSALETCLSDFIGCVLDVYANKKIAPDPAMREQLEILERGGGPANILSKDTNAKVTFILALPEDSDVKRLRELSTEFEKLANTISENGEKEEVPVNYKPYLLKWIPMTTDEEGRPCVILPSGELGARWRTTKTVVKIPPAEAVTLRSFISTASDLYPKLSDFDKEMLAPKLLRASSRLLWSNLREPSEELYWMIFDDVNTHWLNENQLQTSLGAASPFFSQTYDLKKAQKILLKEIELANNFGGGYTVLNLSIALGDSYDQAGDPEKSKQVYLDAKAVCENLLRLKLVQQSDLQHNLDWIDLRLKSPN